MRKEIKFHKTRWNWEGRQDGVIYRIYEDPTLAGTCAPSCSVSAYDTKEQGREIDTAGHRCFHLDAAKEFCQQIAAGELDLAAMRMEFEAENMARERAAVRAAAEDAKKFRARLEAVGLKYTDLLELEVLRHNLGDMGHNILLGYERGEGWPEAAGQTPAEREPETGGNPYWVIYTLPEDCRSLFVFASAEQFDRCVKNGVIPLHDDRESHGEVRIHCFIGYAATRDLKCLDKLAGLSEATQEQGKQHDHSETTGI